MNTKPRVLIVDDEPFYREVLDNLMRGEYDITCVNSGEAALLHAQESPQPELILLDVVMPGLNGYEVCKLLKDDPKTSSIPVIFLTIKTDVDDEVRGFNLGGVDYITKPMSPPIVMARVRTHIKLSRIYHQLKSLVQQISPSV